jgi:hypothetical protein
VRASPRQRATFVHAVQLQSAADELRKDGYETGILYKDPGEVELEEECMGKARAALDGEAFEAAAAVGRSLSISQACELTLSCCASTKVSVS